METIIDPTFPLIDLHRHLDGSVRVSTILELSRQHNLPLPADDIDGLREHVLVTSPKPDIAAFFTKFQYQTGILVNASACRRIAYEAVEDAKHEGIDYIELRFSPWFMAEPHQLHPEAVVEAVVEGVRAGERDFGIKANLIGILSRSYGPKVCFKELAALRSQEAAITALDLAGLELEFPGDLFVEHFAQVRETRWHITVHAGEVDGPQSIWQALYKLDAERLGHAVSAIEDPTLLDYLAEKQIGIESNLTSNVQTSVVAAYDDHPLRLFLERGLLATINTDDPGISGIDLPHEYRVAVSEAGLSIEQARQAQYNALRAAFLSEEEKAALVQAKSAG